jgi:hypothetical protein
MVKDFDIIEHAGNGQLNGVTMDLSSFSTVLQAIFAEGADYTKKSVETRLAVVKTARRQVVRDRDSDPVGICQDGVRRLRRAGDENGRTPFQPRQGSLQAG